MSCDRELGSSWLPISVEGGSAGGLARGQSQRAVAAAGAEVAAAAKYASTYVGGPVVPPASAAITQTLENPKARPHYVLFHNTLCRFPWSFDANG